MVQMRMGQNQSLHITRVFADLLEPGDDALVREPGASIDQRDGSVLLDEREGVDEVARGRDPMDPGTEGDDTGHLVVAVQDRQEP